MNLIGIDPGSNTYGVAVYKVDDNFNIISIKSYVINCTHMEGTSKVSKLARKLKFIRQTLRKIIDEAGDLIALSLESPFIYNSRPAAVIPLAAIKGITEELVLYENPNVLLRAISPSEVKKSAGVKGNDSDKVLVLDALTKINEVDNNIDLDSKTDHEWDAIAVGYELLNYIRRDPLILL